MTRPEAAEYLRTTVGALEQHATRGTGPTYSKPSGGRGRVLYRREDLDAWVEAHLVTSPHKPVPAA